MRQANLGHARRCWCRGFKPPSSPPLARSPSVLVGPCGPWPAFCPAPHSGPPWSVLRLLLPKPTRDPAAVLLMLGHPVMVSHTHCLGFRERKGQGGKETKGTPHSRRRLGPGPRPLAVTHPASHVRVCAHVCVACTYLYVCGRVSDGWECVVRLPVASGVSWRLG